MIASSIVVNPVHKDVMKISSQSCGVNYSTNTGVTGTALNNRLTNSVVNHLALSTDGSILYSATFEGATFQKVNGGE